MPSPGAPPARSLEDFVRFFRALEQAAIDFVVIGGCAVGAYARLAGLRVISSDLDLYVSEAALQELLSWARAARVTIEKLPSPRAVPVAVLSWEGMEINALTASTGLPTPQVAERTARDFELSQHGISIRWPIHSIIPIECSLSPKMTPSELNCFGSGMQAELGARASAVGWCSRVGGARRSPHVYGPFGAQRAWPEVLVSVSGGMAWRG